MKFKNIDSKTSNKQEELKDLIKSIQGGNNVFILIHRVGCPPCEATRPEWLKLEQKLGDKYGKNEDVVIASVEEKYMNGLGPEEITGTVTKSDTDLSPYIGDVDGFPTMKLIKNKGATKEPYEMSNISKKDRSLDSFTEWIETNIGKKHKGRSISRNYSSPHDLLNRLSETESSISSLKRKPSSKKRSLKTKATKKINGGGRRIRKTKSKKRNLKNKKIKTKNKK